MFSFAGWSVIGNLGFSFKDQLSNIILNIFYGTTVNAARGVGIQVCGIVSSFSQNFGMAINPQITKQYAIGDYEKSSLLVYNGARISFYLLAIISIPIIINANYILDLWLVDVPKYTSNFLTLSLITSLIYSLSGTSSVAIQATGRMKVFQIGICLILLLELPIGYILLKFSYPPYFIMIPSLFTYILSIFFRFYLLKSYVRIYRWSIFLKNVVGRCLAVFILSMGSCFVLFSNQQHNFTSFVISAILCVLITIIYIVFLGVSSIERRYLFNKIIMRIKNR